tara:strand:- start:1184 stop:1798 length:615 start_codon:yes stop_codon:yes gene_type:complete
MNHNLIKHSPFSLISGVTLIELLLTITLIAVAILPVISALSDMTEVALIQRDKVSGMTIGTTVMDSYLHQFQLIDSLHEPGFTSYEVIEKTYPPVALGGADLFSPDGLQYRDIFMNGSFYRTTTTFTPMNGTGGSTDLSTAEKLVYRIDLKVWRILHPLLTDDLQNRSDGPFDSPKFSKGDEIVYELSSLYLQNNQFSALFSDS